MKRQAPIPVVLLVLATLMGCGTRSSTVTLPAFGGDVPAPSAAPRTPSADPLPLLTPPPSTPTPSAAPSARAPQFLPSPVPNRNAPSASPTPQTAPSPSAAPSATPTPAGPNPYDIINAAFQLFNNTNTYQATLESYEVGPSKTLRATVNAYFRKPNWFRLEVLTSTDSQSQGTIMVYTGGSTITVQKGIFTLSLSLTDPRLLSPRGDRLDQSDVASILKQFAEPGAQVAYVGSSSLNGRPIQVLELRAPSMQSRNVSKANIGFDVQGKYLVMREEYDFTNRMTLRLTIRNVQLNPSLSASLFSLS